jgi:putative ABC transport system permease protein
MLITYFKVALRNLLNNKLHTIINMGGLALGIASVFFMAIYVKHEWNYDKYLEGYEDVYRVAWVNENPQTRTPHPMAQAMKDEFPEVESAVSLSPLWAAGLTREVFSVRNLEKNLKFDEANVLAVDSTFFDVFPFPVVSGNAREALRNVNGMLISESMAKKYFRTEDPIGKHLAVNSDSTLLEVMAVFKDVPQQSHFHFDFLVSYVREKSFDPNDEYYQWADFGHFNYVRLKPGADAKLLEAKLMDWSRKYVTLSDDEFKWHLDNNYGFKMQPLKDIHLKSKLRWELEPNGNIEYVYIMSAAALLTLLIACINFMNLMTAKSTERAKEIGIRKTLGALRTQLSIQFISESIVVAILSIALAILLVELTLPIYNSFTGQNFVFDYTTDLPVLYALGFVIGVVSGIYPALFLSRFNTQAILKGNFSTGQRGSRLRHTLVVFQFSISMALISGAVIIFNQLSFIKNKNLGFRKEEVLVVPLKNGNAGRRIETLRAELTRLEGITSVSASSNLPGGQYNQNSIFTSEAPEARLDISESFVDPDFFNTLGIQLTSGRIFKQEDYERVPNVFILNETAVKQLALNDPIGKEISWEIGERTLRGQVIGVVKDFHFQSFHQAIGPLLMVPYPAYNHLVIKLNTDHFNEKLAKIRNAFLAFDNTFEFDFVFLDERLDRQYKTEESTAAIFTAFAIIAIVIAGMGLFGMALLSFHQRTKEVGIRKVLGATVTSLLILLLRDFTKLILIAIVLATPVAWWMMDRWLDNFVYQVGIQPLVFVCTGAALLTVSWIILGFLTLKTSQVNPTEVLRTE